MKKFLALLLLSSVASPAFSQAWTTSGPRPVSFPGGASGSYTGVVGDGSDSQGGTPPVSSSEPPDIASNFDTGPWITNTFTTRTAPTGSGEAKFRMVCNASHAAHEDPIIFPGQANVGHHHTFVGNTLGGKDSTYATLRAAGQSTCPGGPVNRTLYWESSVMKVLDSGVAAALKPDRVIFYYVHGEVDAPKRTRLFNGLAFIGGKNPDDMDDSIRKAEIPSGFEWITDGFNGDGNGWYCDGAVGNPKASLKNADGTDPWAGDCTSGKPIYAQLMSPACWDGNNLTSPNGRDHFRYPVRHVNSGQRVCPDGWWQVPVLEAKVFFSHNGPSDYMEWFASSDRMSANPEEWHLNGESMHFDWMNGWDPTVIDTWLVNCTGVTIGATPGAPGGCDYSTISATQRLLSDSPSPDGSEPDPIVNVNLNYSGSSNTERFFPLADGTSGPFTLDSN